MNWGKKILIVYILFVAGIVFMVFQSSTQKIDLVTTDYYAKELKYQDKIDEMNRAAALSAPVIYDIRENNIVITFPKEFNGKTIAGEAVLYCPSDEKKDIDTHFSVTDQPVVIKLSEAHKGQFELHLSWTEAGKTYYFEQKVFI